MLHDSVVLSPSVALSTSANAVGVPSSDMVTLVLSPSVMTGASFTAVTLMVQLCVAAAAPSSPPTATSTVTLALVTPSAGDQSIRPVVEKVMPPGDCDRLNDKMLPLLLSFVLLTTTRYL